ncbi:MAG TPA: hypothetical protein PLI90_10455, partial [Rhodocyclaceae bacterium]|nr:hypothetical protein [Rhodocyclaceae bacterium]
CRRCIGGCGICRQMQAEARKQDKKRDKKRGFHAAEAYSSTGDRTTKTPPKIPQKNAAHHWCGGRRWLLQF